MRGSLRAFLRLLPQWLLTRYGTSAWRSALSIGALLLLSGPIQALAAGVSLWKGMVLGLLPLVPVFKLLYPDASQFPAPQLSGASKIVYIAEAAFLFYLVPRFLQILIRTRSRSSAIERILSREDRPA